MIIEPQARQHYHALSDHGFARVMLNESNGQKSFHTIKAFKAGDLISLFGARTTLPYATYLTVQVGEDRHITLDPEYLQYINHSCDPTAFFDTTTMKLICLRDLNPGDEITFFYPSTEWQMAQPFECHCGSPKCLHSISGASQIPDEVLDSYKLTDFIQSKRVRT